MRIRENKIQGKKDLFHTSFFPCILFDLFRIIQFCPEDEKGLPKRIKV